MSGGWPWPKLDSTSIGIAEVKSAGTALNNNHLRQVVNYGAHKGIEWVLLTNGIVWKVYRISFSHGRRYQRPTNAVWIR